ncbi:MAG: hypothetical protein ACK4E3_06760 [Brevundimonas sp.]|jgi:hypothetical protein|uniref:hypothetical protein n=1 Tax=Brevundimonas sp. TaxID=1871086 RepID=UPI00391A4BE5
MKLLRFVVLIVLLAYAGWLAWPLVSPFFEGSGLEESLSRAGASAVLAAEGNGVRIALWSAAIILYLISAGLLGAGNPRAVAAYALGFAADAVLRLALSARAAGGSAASDELVPYSVERSAQSAGIDPQWMILGALILLGILIFAVSRARRRRRVPGQLAI